MNEQAVFNNMITILNGKGPSRKGRDCFYFPDDGHPGCGIGCQPGFREKFGPGTELEISEGTSIYSMLGGMSGTSSASPYVVEGLRKFFGEDISPTFASSLQELHDDEDSWNEDEWNMEAVAEFASEYNLKIPELTS